jgi:hypothetical protein
MSCSEPGPGEGVLREACSWRMCLSCREIERGGAVERLVSSCVMDQRQSLP